MYRPLIILAAFLLVTIGLILMQPKSDLTQAYDAPEPAVPAAAPAIETAAAPAVTPQSVEPPVVQAPVTAPAPVLALAAVPTQRPTLRPASVTLAANAALLSEASAAQTASLETVEAPIDTASNDAAPVDVTGVEVTRSAPPLLSLAAPEPEPEEQTAAVLRVPAPTQEPEIVTAVPAVAPKTALPTAPTQRSADGTLRASLLSRMLAEPTAPPAAAETLQVAAPAVTPQPAPVTLPKQPADPYVEALLASAGQVAQPPKAQATLSDADIAIRIASAPIIAIHTVRTGDTLADLAERFYGDKDAFIYIYSANRALLPRPQDLEVGQVLRIPSIDNL